MSGHKKGRQAGNINPSSPEQIDQPGRDVCADPP